MLRRNPNGLPSRLGQTGRLDGGGAGGGGLPGRRGRRAPALGRGRPDRPRPAPRPRAGRPPTRTATRCRPAPWPAWGRPACGTAADVTFVAFGPDGKTLLTAGQDNTIRLWDLATGKEIRRFARPTPAAPKLPAKGDKPAQDEKARSRRRCRSWPAGGTTRGSFSVALAPDGKTLAAAGGNVIQLWEVETGKELRQIEGPAGGLAGLLFSPDGRTLAGRAGGRHPLPVGDRHRQGDPPDQARAAAEQATASCWPSAAAAADAPGMAFTPDGKTLAAAATDYKKERDHPARSSSGTWPRARKSGRSRRRTASACRPWPSRRAESSWPTAPATSSTCARRTPARRSASSRRPTAASSPWSSRRTARRWPSAAGTSGSACGRRRPARNSISSATPSRPGAGGGLISSPAASPAPETRALAFSPDGKQIAAAAGSTVRLWETATGKELPLLDGHRQAPSAIALSADGKTVVSWGADRVVRRWEAATGKPLGAFPAPPGTTLAAFSPDGRTVALANADNTIRLHDTATGKELHRLKGHPSGTAALAFAPGRQGAGRRAAAATTPSGSTTWRSGSELRQIAMRPANNPAGGTGHRPRRPAAAARHRARPGLLAGRQAAGGARPAATAPAATRSSSSTWPPARSSARSSRPSPSPASPSRRTAGPWPRRTPTGPSPSGKSPAARSGASWASPSPNSRSRQRRHDGLRGRRRRHRRRLQPSRPARSALAFSPDGRALAVRGPDRSVHVWDVTAGKEIGQLKGHEGRVETVAFAPDGKTLASGSTDTTILLWDAAGPLKDLPKPQAVELPAAEVEALWGDLAGEDAAKALRGVHKLAARPAAGRALPGRAAEAGGPRRSAEDRRLDRRPGEREVRRAAGSGREPAEGRRTGGAGPAEGARVGAAAGDPQAGGGAAGHS